MYKDIKLVAVDLDGTLLDDRSLLTDENIKAIQDLRKTGTNIMICSGKPASMITPYVYELGIDECWYSCYNGSYITNKSEFVLYAKPIDKKVLLETMDYLNSFNTRYNVLSYDCFFHIHESSGKLKKNSEAAALLAAKHNIKTGRVIKVEDRKQVERDDIYKVVVIKGEDEELNQEIYNGLTKIKGISVTSSASTIYDVSSEEASKSEAIRKVADHLNIPLEEVCAIGDYYNDIDMFKLCGLSFAMGNAPIEVGKQATIQIPYDNIQNGVAYIINKYLI